MKCLAILIDALNPVYLAHMPAVARFVGESVSGRLREPLGFVPRAAYFGGLTPDQTGHTHMFHPHVDAAHNPFTVAARLPKHLRHALDAVQRDSQPAFASYYARSQQIPWHLLPTFNVAERHSPWDPRKGYRSLFDELADHGLDWSYIGWPLHQIPDVELAGLAASALEADRHFVFVHLSELDSTGHRHGPHAEATMACCRHLDALVAGLLDRATSRSVLIFGDHGMVPVIRHLNLNLSWLPTGTLHFIDSTSIRIWAPPAVLTLAREKLRDQENLIEMTPELLARHQASSVPNGLMYWTKPGVVLTPNFFGSDRVAGMHGYLPDVFDNESLFAARHPQFAPRTVAPINATCIYPLLQSLLNLGAFPPLLESPVPRYTRVPGGDAIVQTALDLVVSTLRAKHPEITSLHLCGSFGRGEGTILDGHLKNDLDLVFTSSGPLSSSELAATRDELKARLGIPFLDLSLPPPEDGSQFDHDFRHGTQTLFGDPGVVTARRARAADAIPPAALDRMLLNRIAGVLSAQHPPHADLAGYKNTQIIKLGLGFAQRLLALRHAYHASYLVCSRRIHLLPEQLRPALESCFAAKLEGRTLSTTEANGLLELVRHHLSHDRPEVPALRLRARDTWRENRVYRKIFSAFINRRSASPRLISEWFQIIHHA